jgi:OmpA-OmpF porin, OOP family
MQVGPGAPPACNRKPAGARKAERENIMFNAKRAVLLGAMALAGCTTSSSLTHSTYSVSMSNGEQAYRVTCYGLLVGAGTCRRAAEAICKDRSVTVLERQSLLGATSGGPADDRNLLFQCGEPQDAVPGPAMPEVGSSVAPVSAN